jgi:hypothetical protein
MSSKQDFTQDELIAVVPQDAKRLLVEDQMGKQKWRNVETGFDSLEDGDKIVHDEGVPRIMLHSPGRRKKLEKPAPVSKTAGQVAAAKSQHLKSDKLLASVRENFEQDSTFQQGALALAEEISSLKFEREEEERKGQPTSQVSMRRIGATKALLDTWIKRKDQLSAKTIDLDSNAFHCLFAFLIETFRDSMLAGGIPDDQIEAIFADLSKSVLDETWRLEATNRMKKGS